jgi:ketol-acid reductoisomerase
MARATIARVRDGSFASDLVDDQRSGHERLDTLTAASQHTAMGEAEARLRRLLGREE